MSSNPQSKTLALHAHEERCVSAAPFPPNIARLLVEELSEVYVSEGEKRLGILLAEQFIYLVARRPICGQRRVPLYLDLYCLQHPEIVLWCHCQFLVTVGVQQRCLSIRIFGAGKHPDPLFFRANGPYPIQQNR